LGGLSKILELYKKDPYLSLCTIHTVIIYNIYILIPFNIIIII